MMLCPEIAVVLTQGELKARATGPETMWSPSQDRNPRPNPVKALIELQNTQPRKIRREMHSVKRGWFGVLYCPPATTPCPLGTTTRVLGVVPRALGGGPQATRGVQWLLGVVPRVRGWFRGDTKAPQGCARTGAKGLHGIGDGRDRGQGLHLSTVIGIPSGTVGRHQDGTMKPRANAGVLVNFDRPTIHAHSLSVFFFGSPTPSHNVRNHATCP